MDEQIDSWLKAMRTEEMDVKERDREIERKVIDRLLAVRVRMLRVGRKIKNSFVH